jgi:hypothetical protein
VYTASVRRLSALLVPLLLCVACATPLRPPPRSGWGQAGPDPRTPVERADGAVLVHFPAGACATGWLEIEVFDPGTGMWMEHPDGGRVRTDSCRFERPERLLSETRVRCYDPGGLRPASPWVIGVAVDGSQAPRACPESNP